MPNNINDTPSRLLTNSARIRYFLETRNLYTPDDPYNLFRGDPDDEVPTNPYLDKRKVANTINGIAGVLKPFSSFDVTNTIIGRVVGPATPLATIGVTMLAKQFAQSVISNASREVLPAINFINLFDGDPNTKFISKAVDYEVTRRSGQTNISRIIESLAGTYDYLHHGYPFSKYKKGNEYRKYGIQGHNKEFIGNTGKGQLQLIYKNINDNTYKLQDSGMVDSLSDVGLNLQSGVNNWTDRPVFPSPNDRFYPFKQYDTGLQNINFADLTYNEDQRVFIRGNKKYGVVEYGNSTSYVEAMGITEFDVNQSSGEYDYNSENFGFNDNINLVWGRDGVNVLYESAVGGLKQGDDELPNDNNNTASRFDTTDGSAFGGFNIETGLLSYTRQLLNSQGKYGSFDLTRKKFLDKNNNIHFNGSPLDTHPDGVKDSARRHSMADQYDRYAKAIRFDGNKIYEGNENSVIYKSVIPKFAPSSNKQVVDNSNLMFSIENLAVQVRREESGLGTIESERSITLPTCEIGQQGGRLMWFPPYDVRFSESAVARWDTNTFIGRSEPIYTYSSSERLANLSFKLLVDYPEQLLAYKDQKDKGSFHQTISEFFAFGGKNKPFFDDDLGQKQILITEKQRQKEELDDNKEYVEPNTPSMVEFEVYFPNDYPRTNQGLDTNVFLNLYTMGYEDGDMDENDLKDPGYVDNGLNKPFIENLGSQEATNILTQYFNPDDNNLFNEKGEPYTKIYVGGGATTLFYDTAEQAEYNQKLSERRQEATKIYIENLIKSTFGRSATELKIKVIANKSDAVGSTQSDPANGTEENIHSVGAKKERYGSVRFVRDSAMVQRTKELDGETRAEIQKLNDEIASLQKEINETKRKMLEYSPCIYKSNTKEDGIGKGFSSFRDSKFNPVFHTQTPEDLHRRLTFLQQCTKQGEAVRYKSDGVNSAINSVFGRQPVCIFRYGDFMHTKIVIDNISFSYEESTWDLNPEGFGMQPMIVEVSMQMKILGGQSLRTPIDALQNAISFNYYANSTYTDTGVYADATLAEELQIHALRGGGALTTDEVDSIKNLGRESNFNLPQLQRKSVSTSIGSGGLPESLG